MLPSGLDAQQHGSDTGCARGARGNMTRGARGVRRAISQESFSATTRRKFFPRLVAVFSPGAS
jgi:hypothetical protein